MLLVLCLKALTIRKPGDLFAVSGLKIYFTDQVLSFEDLLRHGNRWPSPSVTPKAWGSLCFRVLLVLVLLNWLNKSWVALDAFVQSGPCVDTRWGVFGSTSCSYPFAQLFLPPGVWICPTALSVKQIAGSSSQTIPVAFTSPSHIGFACGNMRGDGWGWEKG